MSNFDFLLKRRSMIGRTESEYVCKTCGVSETSNSSILRHIESNHMKVDHPCILCESKAWFRNRSSLKTHIQRHHK